MLFSAPQLVAYGTFLNVDTTRIISKRIILSGHPFKVHKKTATIRYMFFNPGMIYFVFCVSWQARLTVALVPRRRALFQAHPAPHKAWSCWSYQGVTRHTWLLQGILRWPNQPDGHDMHVAVQTNLPSMGSALSIGQ